MVSMCVENPSPSWNEDHADWNLHDPISSMATLDGFVFTAAHDARTNQPPFTDVDGIRAMGHYTGTDLPYYYFMASNFGTSDRWFSPVMSRTQPNRLYMLAGTSAGHVYPPSAPLSNPTIFDSLQAAGVSWKVYVTDLTYATPPVQDSTINMFATASKYPNNIVPVSQFLTDAANAALPSVAFIDPGFSSGLDEHPGIGRRLTRWQRAGGGTLRFYFGEWLNAESFVAGFSFHSHLGRVRWFLRSCSAAESGQPRWHQAERFDAR